MAPLAFGLLCTPVASTMDFVRRLTMRHALWLPLVLTIVGCDTAPKAVPLDSSATCGLCQQAVTSAEFAAQLLEPGASPLFFDDIECLFGYLARDPQVKPGTIAYVADHHTSEWTQAASALYSRVEEARTPHNSHLMAHSGKTSRAADPDARGGTTVTVTDLFQGPIPNGR
jgi:hypothetical protein